MALRQTLARPTRKNSTLDTESRIDITQLEATAHFGALYVQCILLHADLKTGVTERIHAARCEDSVRRNTGRDVASDKNQMFIYGQSGMTRGETSIEPESNATTTGRLECPVALLNFLWWVEKRLSIAQWRAGQLKGWTRSAKPDSGVLLRLLRNVMGHPLVAKTLTCTLEPGGPMPSIELLVSLEAAMSDEDLGGSSTQLTFLKAITLGRLVRNAENARSTTSRSGTQFGEERNNGQSDVSGGLRVSTSLGRQKTEDRSESSFEDAKKVWRGCVASLLREPRICYAARSRIICRDSWTHGLGYAGAITMTSSREDQIMWAQDVHQSWKEGSDVTTEACSLLDALLEVMAELCNSEALPSVMRLRGTRGSLTHNTNDEHGLGELYSRKASLLLREALGIAQQPGNASQGAIACALLLLADRITPIIHYTEGHIAAKDAIRLLWTEYFSKFRPLEPGAVATLTRLALIAWCHHGEGGKGSVQEERCMAVEMFEDLPLLAYETARVWPVLSNSFQYVFGAPGDPVTPNTPRDCAYCLYCLHHLGRTLAQDLSCSRFGQYKGNEVGTNSTSPSAKKGTNTRKMAKVDTAIASGRIPLGQVNNDTQDHGGHCTQLRDGKACVVDEAQATCPLDENGTEDSSSADEEALAVELPAIFDWDRLREVSNTMPRSCAGVVICALDAAAELIVKKRRKRPRQISTIDAGAMKKVKAKSSTMASPAALSKDTKERQIYRTVLTADDSGMPAADHLSVDSRRLPPAATWATTLVESMYGPRSRMSSSSPLHELVHVTIEFLRGIEYHGGKWSCTEGTSDNGQASIAKRLVMSLLIAILRCAPSLVSVLLESPSLGPSGTSARAEKLEESVTILEFLALLSKEPTLYTSLRKDVGELWVQGIIHHYSAVLYGMRNVLTLRNTDTWGSVVAFVHTQIRDVAPERLRRMPAAVVLQEIDPLLKQYF